MTDPKLVEFCGSALDDLRAFPQGARREAGYQNVGWVERSETHQSRKEKLMGFAALYPSYGY